MSMPAMRNAPDCWIVMTLRSSATVKTARTSVIVVPERIEPAKAFWRLKRSRNPKKAGSLASTNAKKNNGIRTIVFESAKRLGMSSLTPVEDEEERNQKAVSDRIQLLLRGFARRKKLDDDAGNECAQDVFCTDVFSQDDQSDDDCKRQTHVDLRS